MSDVISTYKCRGPYDGTFGKKTKGEGKAWHPGLLGHKYRADSLSYFLLEIFKEALDDVIVASMEGPKTLHDLRQQALEALTLSGAHLPKPVACDPQVCLKIPKCFTNYEPRIQNDLLERIVPTRDLPQSSFPKSSQQFSLASLLPLNWAYDLSWFDKAGVKKASDEQRGYLDQKYILRSNFSGSGPLTEEDGESVLTFLVEPSVRSPIWICQVQKGFLKYPSTDSELDVGASVSITSHVDHNVMRSFHSGLKGFKFLFESTADLLQVLLFRWFESKMNVLRRS